MQYSSEAISQGKKDRQFDEFLHLYDLSGRLKDVSHELGKLPELFSNYEDLSAAQKRFIKSTKTTMIPFLDEASERIVKASTLLCPIPGSKYAHAIKETDKKQQPSPPMTLKQTKSCISSPLRRIELFRTPVKTDKK